MGWYHGDSHPVLRPRTGSRASPTTDSQRTGQLFPEGCKDIMSAALVGLAGGIIVILKAGGLVIDTILQLGERDGRGLDKWRPSA